ncbi:MAG: DUF4190 domain-containing protein [bacterium]|nr:DUF4190 domain-containing protein [bacterium]
MMDQVITNYIKKCRELGQGDKDIESFLLKAHHDKADITAALSFADDLSNAKSTSPVAPPASSPAIEQPATKAKDKQLATAQPEKENIKPKKDPVAVMSFIFGLLPILFYVTSIYSTSIIPLAALVLGIWGVVRTKTKGTGRWMAIAGLVLGIWFLISR